MIIDRILHKVERNFHIKEKYDKGVRERFAAKMLPLFDRKKGIEIGGPSPIFSNELPIYAVAESLDGCNFSNDTVWEGSIKEGAHYNYFHDKTGYQFISEASNLDKIQTGEYDFLLASHCLEHCANVIKTIKEWLRVLKPGGVILLILPKKENTFDNKRQVTSFDHLMEDYNNNVNETDLTHLEEIINDHDLSRDMVSDKESFRKRSLQNFQNRCLHHHVFDFKLLEQVFTYLDVQVDSEKFIPPYHQIIVGVKE